MVVNEQAGEIWPGLRRPAIPVCETLAYLHTIPELLIYPEPEAIWCILELRAHDTALLGVVVNRVWATTGTGASRAWPDHSCLFTCLHFLHRPGSRWCTPWCFFMFSRENIGVTGAYFCSLTVGVPASLLLENRCYRCSGNSSISCYRHHSVSLPNCSRNGVF